MKPNNLILSQKVTSPRGRRSAGIATEAPYATTTTTSTLAALVTSAHAAATDAAALSTALPAATQPLAMPLAHRTDSRQPPGWYTRIASRAPSLRTCLRRQRRRQRQPIPQQTEAPAAIRATAIQMLGTVHCAQYHSLGVTR